MNLVLSDMMHTQEATLETFVNGGGLVDLSWLQPAAGDVAARRVCACVSSYALDMERVGNGLHDEVAGKLSRSLVRSRGGNACLSSPTRRTSCCRRGTLGQDCPQLPPCASRCA